MHILLVADGRSPITNRWIQGLIALRHDVTLVSTFPCEPLPYLKGFEVIPVAMGNLGGSQLASGTAAASSGFRKVVGRFRKVFLSTRYVIGPLTIPFFKKRFRRIVEDIKPDLVHALRIPFEGMLAATTPPETPLVISIWGNDLTLHAKGSRCMQQGSLITLRRSDGLMADAARDIRLGRLWGFAAEKPTLVVPGSGGIDLSELYRLQSETVDSAVPIGPAGVPTVVNPRGFRPGSVHNEVFFQSIPLILERRPDVQFICTAMAGQPEALRWIDRLKIEKHVRLLPFLPQQQLWSLFMRADVSISVSSHDGTPNSLLEAMACGCFPVAGDIESLREWIVPGVNGLLVEPSKPQALAQAVLLALDHPEMRKKAAEINLKLIRERADVNLVRSQIQVFYQRFMK